MSRSLCVVVVAGCVMVLGGAYAVAEDAGDADAWALAETLDGLKQQRADVQAKENELRQKQAKLIGAIRQMPEVIELQETFNQTRAERDKFVATDPALKEAAEERHAAQQSRQKTHNTIVAESEEGKTIAAERQETSELLAVNQYEIRLNDTIRQTKVQHAVAATPAVTSAQKAESAARVAWEQARREKEQTDEMREMARERDVLRRKYEAIRKTKAPEELVAAEKALRDAEEKLRKVRDAELGALFEAAVDEARTAHEKAIAAKLDADEDAKTLNQEMAELREKSADTQYKLRLAEFKLCEGVRGKILRSPEIQALGQEVWKADHARQQAERGSEELAAARKAVEEARTKVNELRPTHQALRQAEDAWRAADQKYRKEIDAAGEDERKAWDEKRKAVQEALQTAMAADAAAQELASEREALVKVSQELHEKSRELNNKYHELSRTMASNDEVKAAQETERAAHENYQTLYRASKAPELDKKHGAASHAYHQKVRELSAADETLVEVEKELTKIRERMRAVDQAIREKAQQAAKA